MGSTSVPHADAPQHELFSPAKTRRAASPYFSFTTSLIPDVLILPSMHSHTFVYPNMLSIREENIYVKANVSCYTE